jgi:hypothetical protein
MENARVTGVRMSLQETPRDRFWTRVWPASTTWLT